MIWFTLQESNGRSFGRSDLRSGKSLGKAQPLRRIKPYKHLHHLYLADKLDSLGLHVAMCNRDEWTNQFPTTSTWKLPSTAFMVRGAPFTGGLLSTAP